jgi:hypothetical protein
MKLLILILVLAISAQPLQAGACDMDMEKNQESTHHMDMSGPNGHDCCDTEDTDSLDGCEAGMNCGMCFVSVSAISSIPRTVPVWSHLVYLESSSGVILPSHSSPPFRPPIA